MQAGVCNLDRSISAVHFNETERLLNRTGHQGGMVGQATCDEQRKTDGEFESVQTFDGIWPIDLLCAVLNMG